MENDLLDYVLKLKKGKIDKFDYCKKTKLERDLYLKIDSLIQENYAIELGGFSEFRKKEITDLIRINKVSKEHANIIFEGFEICKKLRSVSSNDPYWIDDSDDLSCTADEQIKIGIAIEKILMKLDKESRAKEAKITKKKN